MTTETEKLLLSFTVSQAIRAIRTEIKQNEHDLKGPLAIRALERAGITKEEVLSEIQEKKESLQAIEKFFKEYTDSLGIAKEDAS